MPANIARDQYGFLSVYADELPWHPEVGALVKGARNAEGVIRASRQNGGPGLGFIVEASPSFHRWHGKFVEDGFVDLRRKDTGEVFGKATPDYVPIQNIDALRLPEAIVGTKRAGWISAGAIGNGAKLFATLDLSRLADVRVKGDPSKHKPFLSITWAHDALEAVRIAFWDRRLECANMRAMFLAGTERDAMTVRIRHTGDVKGQMDDAQVILGFAENAIKSHTQLMAVLNDTAIPAPTNKWIANFLEQLVPIPEGMVKAHMREATREGIADLIKHSKTLRGVPMTLYRVQQAVDEYADNVRPIRSADPANAAMLRLLGDGPAADLKRRSLDLVRAELATVSSN